jgi:tight adherence protein B
MRKPHIVFYLGTLLLAAAFMSGCGGAVAPAGPNPAVKARFDNVDCAAKKMQLFYYYYDLNRKADANSFPITCNGVKTVYKVPKWLDAELPAMTSHAIWRDPAEGDLREANLWQTPVSLLYMFLDLSKKTFPTEFEGGQDIKPALLVKEYADIRSRFQMSLDRLYRSRLQDSMDGRGRTMMSDYDLILRQMDSVEESMASNNPTHFNNAIDMIASLSQDTFNQIQSTVPRQKKSTATPSAMDNAMPWILTMLGMLVIVIGIMRIFGTNPEGVNHLAEDYMKRVRQWSDAFNRQFIKIKVHYLVMAPIAVFGFAGLLTFNIFGFLILTSAGVYIGLHMPTWTLNFLKERRGKQIDVQLMDGLILMSNALKSGLDIVQGFEMISHDLQPPISEEFGLVLRNYQLGTPFERALEGMEERVASRLLAYMIRAIMLQRQVGGNLTKVFERIVENIREESKLEQKTKSLTAQQRIQSIVVGLMPWVMLLVMFLFQGDVMMKFYFSPLGMIVLVFCALWIGIGMKIVSSMGNIKV